MKLNSPLPQPLSKECAKAAKIFKSFVDSGNNGLDGIIPRSVLWNAKGFAIFTVVKAGFLFSARAGSGVVIAKLEDGSWSAPSAIGTGGVGFGGQAGAEMTDFLVVLNSRSAVKSFMSAGSLTLGGNLSIAVGPLGRNGEAIGSLSTSGKVAAMYSYSKTRGLFGGVSIEGSVIVERQDANAQAYRGDVSVKALLSGAIPPPEWASSLIKTLEACTGMPGNRRWVQEFQAHHGDDYVFNGMESTRTDDLGLTPTSSGTTYADVGSVRPKKSKSRSSSFGFPPTSWGKRKGSGSYFESEFHDPSRAPIPVDQSSASSASAKRSWEDRPSPRWNRPLNTTTGYFDTKFESDYVSDEQLRRHPRLSTLANEKAKDPDEFQDGSPFNSLPPFDAARSSLTGSDATSHRRAFSAYAPRQASKTGADLFDSSDVDLYGSPNSDDVDDFGYGARSLSSARSKSNRTPVKLTAKTELTRPLMPHEGVVRAIALFTFRAVQPGDLSFEKGQVITVTEKSEDTNTWWKGKVDGREGVFPANFVEVV